ncbi:protoheme IX farnesyltransferase [Modicisalibacter ilicicola DSM 19980]|uniref:Protoheme IX farnesyltransferase n=1 Tax=Modicisalibacter ilicicola DSM 19980 TaxID=1121942 RepID=A0A1M4T2N3_9GAMM|nr:heme o synthase [Halomonas ilicicola]SHE38685.1 protoheme IX farnesyltransferase [Halomonas ilicicola DSM 19980]
MDHASSASEHDDQLAAHPAVFRTLLSLTKPGIILGNLISVTGGFFLAAQATVSPVRFLATLLGVALVIASGCVFNNVIDRDIDARMRRTRDRALVQGLISVPMALVYATLLGTTGVLLLYLLANPLAAFFAILGIVVYVGLYTLWFKRHSVHGTLIGSLSGAMPPVIGYCAAADRFDLGAAILLVIFSLWQMPHSYAIAIFRLEDYKAASIPVLPVEKGIEAAKRAIVRYIVAFAAATVLLSLTGHAGHGYLVVAGGTSLYWLHLALSGYRRDDDEAWARRQFAFSIVMVMVLSLMMVVDFGLSFADDQLADASYRALALLRTSG